MNDKELKYFRDSWHPNYDKFKYSGWSLLDKISDRDIVLDIGCGYNLFKEKLGDRIYGIDPANDKADKVIAWEDYKPHWFYTVFLALGSLNFGTEEEVEAQVAKMSKDAIKGTRVYWRQNPGTGDHPWKGIEDVRFFPWSFRKNIEWCEKYRFKLVELKYDSGNRIYSEWTKQ